MLTIDLLLKDELNKRRMIHMNIIYIGDSQFLTKGKMYNGTLNENGTFTLKDDTNLDLVIAPSEFIEYVPSTKKEKLVPLNFRVTEEFRKEYKLFALENNMNGHELFYEMYALYRSYTEGRM